MIVISDNSVLSCLSEIGELDLLQRLYGRVTITETIRREAVHPSAPEVLRLLFLKMPDWISVVPDESSYLEETGVLGAGGRLDAISCLINSPNWSEVIWLASSCGSIGSDSFCDGFDLFAEPLFLCGCDGVGFILCDD